MVRDPSEGADVEGPPLAATYDIVERCRISVVEETEQFCRA